MYQARYKKLGHDFVEFATSGYVVPQVATQQQIHDQVDSGSVLKCKVHIHDKLWLYQL